MQSLIPILWLVILGSASAAKPNVLFIAIDDLRAELGCYGADHIVSPNIDKLAASGVRFGRAYCQQAICGPSRASVMTGLRPDSTRVHGNHKHFRKIQPDIVTLPQHFKNNGYHSQSMGKIYHGVFPPGSSITVADTFGDEPSWSVPTFRPGLRYYYTEEGVDAAKQVFQRIYKGKGDYACISYIDAQVGKVLGALEQHGLADNTIVVLWADHGYHLGEKGMWGKTTNYELDARVPLIVRAPGKAGNGQASQALVELVDLYPSLADLAGLPIGDSLEGHSFAPLLDKPDAPWNRAAFTQFSRGEKRGYSIATRNYRYVEWYKTATVKLVARELYDRRDDPQERRNLAETKPDVARRLARLLDRGEGWRSCAPQAALTVAAIFGDSMVLQRGKVVPVWGTALAGESVVVSFGGQRVTAKADRDGRWRAELEPMEANAEGQRMGVVAGERELAFEDILVGEVWICAGQSNMRWMVKQSRDGMEAIATADNPQLRLIDFTGKVYPTAKRYSKMELREAGIDGYYSTDGWRQAAGETVPTFSAVAYYFGVALQRELGVPVGLVHNAIGGVPMETYIPREAFEADPRLAPLLGDWMNDPKMPAWVRQRGGQNLAAWKENPTGMRPHHPFEPGFLFEAGMRPLVPMSTAGFLWYQGESNATENGSSGGAVEPAINEHKFKTLITSWRDAWGDDRLPFYFAQLPGLNRDWPPFREMQRKVAADLEGVGMVVTLDLGHATNVHPNAKKPVGERLARQVLAKIYGQKGIDPDGPVLVEQKIVRSALDLRFDKSLATSDGEAPRGFSIAGKDEVFHPAEVVVSGNRLTLSSPKVSLPVAARYAWANDPDANLTNTQGMLASPFRTDTFAFATAVALTANAAALPVGTMSFEDAKTGALTELATPSGTWTAKPGHAEVTDKFAHSGKQSLKIVGGKDHAIEFAPIATDKLPAELTFRAERWTSRSPFAFGVEARVGGKWAEIYRGDKVVRVGARFLTPVSIKPPANADCFRFTCTAPKGGGILIDDVRLAPAVPMEVSLSVESCVVPMLVGKKDNVALNVNLDAAGTLDAKTVNGILIDAVGEGIKAVRVLIDGSPFGEEQPAGKGLKFEGEHLLADGRNTFAVSLELCDDADIDGKVAVHCPMVTLVSGDQLRSAAPAVATTHRIGVALRQRGQDKSDAYRIPGLATTNRGTLIAVYDNRHRGGGDLPGDIDVGMSRSTDGGQTWESMKVIMDMGNDPKWRYDGIGDPAVLVDRQTNTIWVAATWSHGNRSWHGSGPGMKPEETGQFMLVKSENDGLTWSKPVNITAQIKDPKWRFVLQGPGKGIMLKDGTLVFPAQFRGENEAPVNGKPFSTLIYSKDRGETWTIGTGVKIDTTEAQLVELGDGSIMINCRDNRGGSRSVYTTKDLGKTWQVHPTSRSALPDPVCMASLIRVENAQHGELLFFSNPAQTRGRQRMTIKVSDDEGTTWPEKWHNLIDEGSSMYSCMTLVGDDHIGLFYEAPGEIYFLRVPIAEMLGNCPQPGKN